MDKYVCRECAYIYDEDKGDPTNGISSETPFGNLPQD